MTKLKSLLVVLLVGVTAGPVLANNFRAADIVYLNAAGRFQGAAFFKTDIVIRNMSNDDVVVDVAYLPTGQNNANLGTVVTLETLGPGEAREYRDVMDTIFELDSGFGHLLFFSCREGGDCSACPPPGVEPTDCLTIAVEGRVYAETDVTGNLCPAGESECSITLGQLFPGLPWFLYASRDDVDWDEILLMGFRVEGAVNVGGYRSNLGLVNSSAFSSTTLQVTLYNMDGTQFGQPLNINLPPLGHLQNALGSGGANNWFNTFEGQGYVIVRQISVTPTSPNDPDVGDGVPGFFAYGSVLDNLSDDPTTLEPIFPKELPWDLVFVKGQSLRRPVNRPN